MKIIILNLSRNTTEAELAEKFKAFGSVTNCNIVLDKATGMSKGFGFVEMPDASAAKEAIEKLHGTKFALNKIRVKEAS